MFECLGRIRLLREGLHVPAGFTETTSLDNSVAHAEPLADEMIERHSSGHDVPSMLARTEVNALVFLGCFQCLRLNEGDRVGCKLLTDVIQSLTVVVAISFQPTFGDGFDRFLSSWFVARLRRDVGGFDSSDT
jgi:hypothetical protein